MRLLIRIVAMIVGWLFLVGLFVAGASAQNNGAFVPYIPLQFFNASGLAAANGRLCSLAAGTTNSWLATYQNSSLATPNANPQVLSATGHASTAIFLTALSYKFILYAPYVGVGTNTCNGTPVGASIWTQDNIYDFALLMANGLVSPVTFNVVIAKNIDNVRKCDGFPGATGGAKIIACLADLPSSGGTADARGLEGAQTIVANIAIGANKTLLIGAATYTCNFAGICLTLNGSGAKLVGTSRDTSIITQTTTAAPFSLVSVTASNYTIQHIELTGLVTAGTEADEGLADILLTYTGSPAPQTNGTIDDVYLAGKVGGIFSYNAANNAFIIDGLRVTNSRISTLHYGVFIGGYLHANIDNNNIFIAGNDIEVTSGSYTGFQQARPLQIWDANAVTVSGNMRLRGGFSCVELISGPASGPGYRLDNLVIGNKCDSHLSFTQAREGLVNSNVVDMDLRDASWPTYTNATVVAAYTYLPAAEISDNYSVTVTGNTFRRSAGACVDFSAERNGTLSGNTMLECGTQDATPPSYAHCIVIFYGPTTNLNSIISNNTVHSCARSGIAGSDDVLTYGVSGYQIKNNAIDGTKEHGIHLPYVANLAQGGPTTVQGNSVTTVNGSGGTHSAIDFTSGAGQSINGLTVSLNVTSGGVYGIYQPYADEGAARNINIFDNTSFGATTAPFFIYGRRHGNNPGSATFGPTISIAATHISVTSGQDTLQLNPGATFTMGYIDDGSIGDTVTVFFNTGGTLTNVLNRLTLNGGIDATVTTGSMMTFRNTQNFPTNAQSWYEVSRMIR